MGCENVACKNDKLFGSAINAARQADATVLVMGLDQSIEAETVDRTGLLLPGRQQDLVSKVAAASKGPTILVIMSGGSVDITFAKNNPRIVGILWAGYPGQAGGAAIADILFGTANPGLSHFRKMSQMSYVVFDCVKSNKEMNYKFQNLVCEIMCQKYSSFTIYKKELIIVNYLSYKV